MKILNNQKASGETCVICKHHKVNGFFLYTSYICMDCQHELVNTNTDDPKYTYFVQSLKVISTPKIYS